jgi:hypothetical protein
MLQSPRKRPVKRLVPVKWLNPRPTLTTTAAYGLMTATMPAHFKHAPAGIVTED